MSNTATWAEPRRPAPLFTPAAEWPSLWDAAGLADEDLSWQDFALCKETDPEAFFPIKGGSTREAKSVCHGCEVRDQCLEYALAHDDRFGIWGGLSERERRALKKTRTGES